MAANDFLVFGGGAGSNVLSQGAWAALAARTAGFSSGVAQSAQLNKAWRQSSIMAAVLAQFIADNSGQDAVDDGTIAALLANLGLALRTFAPSNLGHGQCRLSVASSTSLVLSPYNGNNLIINGVSRQIPAGGISITNAGLTANTVYRVYAFMNGANMALELSTTARATHTNGVEIKNGDASRTLVGMIATNASSQFQNTFDFSGCANWFNRRRVYTSFNTTGLSFTNTTVAELSSLARLRFLSWGDAASSCILSGYGSVNVSGGTISLQAYLNGAPWGGQSQFAAAGVTPTYAPVSSGAASVASEGLNTATVYGYVSGGTGSLGAGSNFSVTTDI